MKKSEKENKLKYANERKRKLKKLKMETC